MDLKYREPLFVKDGAEEMLIHVAPISFSLS